MISVPYGVVRPDTNSTYDPCIKCLSTDGKWLVKLSESVEPWCSHCFLYKTEWGAANRAQIDELAREVEVSMARTITDITGSVIPIETDRILMSIVLISGYVNKKR